MKPVRTLIYLLMLSQAAPAAAQSIVGIDFLIGDVYSIDPKTGQAAVIGSTGLNQYLWHSMAKDSQGRIVAGYWDPNFVSTGTGIYELDPVTAQATLVFQAGQLNIISMTFGMNDVLYALHSPGTSGSPPYELYSVDLISGVVTLIGSTGQSGIQGLAYGQGALWGWQGDPGMGLLKIDPVTAQVTDVNPAVGGLYWDLAQTLFFSDNGVLYGGFGSLFVIDTVTGVPTYVGYMHGAGFIAGMEFLPNQPPPFALGVMGVSGGPMGAFAAGATPGANVAFFRASGGGGPATIPSGNPCAGTLLNLNSGFTLLSLARADAQGRAQIGPRLVPPLVPREWRLQALDLATCQTSNRGTIGF